MECGQRTAMMRWVTKNVVLYEKIAVLEKYSGIWKYTGTGGGIIKTFWLHGVNDTAEFDSDFGSVIDIRVFFSQTNTLIH